MRQTTTLVLGRSAVDAVLDAAERALDHACSDVGLEECHRLFPMERPVGGPQPRLGLGGIAECFDRTYDHAHRAEEPVGFDDGEGAVLLSPAIEGAPWDDERIEL